VVTRALYWIAVAIVSIALVVGLVLWFESRDASEIGATPPALSAAA
jgi:hypothetical protein